MNQKGDAMSAAMKSATRAWAALALVALLAGCPTEPTQTKPTPPTPTPPTTPTLPTPPAAQTITSNGGTLSFQSGQVTMTFPAGAVAADTSISIAPITTPPADGVPGTVYAFTPDGITFAQPVKLSVKYDPAQIPKGTLETQIVLAKVKGDGWQPLETSLDQTAKTVSADLNGFSSYGAIPTVKAWTFGGSAGQGTTAADIAADDVGNVYVIGSSDDYGGPVTQSNKAFVSSFTRDGTPRSGWPVRLSLPSDFSSFQLTAVAVDASGNFVCATGLNTKSLPNGTPVGNGQVVVCYTPDGKVRSGWPVFTTYSSGSGSSSGGIALDANANVYVSGANAGKVFVTSYNSSGALRAGWPRTFGVSTAMGSVNRTYPGGLTLDSSANVFMAWISTPWPNGGSIIESLTSNGQNRAGFPVIVQGGAGGNYNSVTRLAKDATGNTVVAWTDFLKQTTTLTSLNPSGVVRSGWPKLLEPTPPFRFAFSGTGPVAVNALGNVFIVTPLDPRTDPSSSNYEDVWLTSFNSSGAVRSGYPKILGSEFSDTSYALAVNVIGDVFVAGATNGVFQGLPIAETGASPVGFVARVRGY